MYLSSPVTCEQWEPSLAYCFDSYGVIDLTCFVLHHLYSSENNNNNNYGLNMEKKLKFWGFGLNFSRETSRITNLTRKY